ncbi:hypothetical protein SAMN05445060_1227 [Williamsia sterculiae]|uniref:DUF5642 domain-containing protein n=1 Tax=Williamsia sterculiae TaxID=1344003 RepID=A0A1N7EEJ9_9NOCA|nr:hypothetical protein SAMN05445060_1227 [Williamsia sterculiae]
MLCLACVAAVMMVSGCGRAIEGIAVAATPTSPSVDVGALALTPADFPAGYSADRLRSQQATDVLADLLGVPVGATVLPASCAPPAIDPSRAVVVTGMPSATSTATRGGNLTVVTAAVDAPLRSVATWADRCRTYATSRGAAATAVTVTTVPPAPVESQESFAMRRVVTSTTSLQKPQTTTMLIAQNDGIRVYAAYLSYTSDKPDGAALDEVFTTAVRKSRQR